MTSYSDHSWHPVRDEWVIGPSQSYSFRNNTNNRLESTNQKLKQVISKRAKVCDFERDFVTFLATHRTEIDGKLSRTAVKVPVHQSGDEVHRKYRQHLTQYAFNLVVQQLSQVVKESDELCAKYAAAEEDCTCPFRKQYLLPCRHIFWKKEQSNVSLYDETLITNRWQKAYYLQCITEEHQPAEVISSTLQTTQQPKSQQQKFRAASHVSTKLAVSVAEATGNEFDVKLDLLRTLLNA